jgi:hypothetical protein
MKTEQGSRTWNRKTGKAGKKIVLPFPFFPTFLFQFGA